MQLRFYKDNGKWYADVPGHTQEENEMVCGADTFLDYVAKGKSEVNVGISTTPTVHSIYADATLYVLKHDSHGATYQIVSKDPHIDTRTLWICNVTHDVLGEHPPYIFIFLK